MSFPPRSLVHGLPFFYGWLVAAVSGCANVARQAAAVAPLSIFIVPMTTEFDWSRTSLSGAVSLGGLLGAFISPILGRLVDRRGPRLILVVSTLVIAGACFALAGTESLLAFYIAFAIGRMTFLGPMDIGPTAAMAKWFVRQRARAMSFMSLGHYVGLALLPLLAQFVINEHGWRAGWVSLGVVVLLIGTLPVALFIVGRPEDVGLEPDGHRTGAGEEGNGRSAAHEEYSFTLREALRTPVMWLLMVYSGLIFMVQAGMSLHQAPHLVQAGLSPTVAASIVSVFSLSAAGSTLLVGILGHRLPAQIGLVIGALIVGISTVLMHDVTTPAQGFAAAMCFGAGLGIAATLLPVAWADYFGREHYGAIRGAALSVQVIGQAAGPLIAGILYDLSGSYHKPFVVFFGLAAACVFLALLANKPAVPAKWRSRGRPSPMTAAAPAALAAAAVEHAAQATAQANAAARADGRPVYPIVRLLASLLLMTLGGSAMYASITVLEPLIEEFGGGRGSGSFQYTLYMIGFGAGGVLMGRLSDRTGVLVPILIGSLCLPLGFLAASHATEMWHFLVAMGVLCGLIGASSTFAPLVSDISLWFTARRGLAVGIVVTGTYVAGALWPPILQAAYDAQGWRETFRDLALLTICGMLPLSALMYRKPPVPPDEDEASGGGGSRTMGLRPNGLQCLLCVAGIGCCVAMAMPQVHIIPYVLDQGLPAARGAEMLSLMLGFGIVSRLASGWLSDRIGGLQTLIVGSALQGIVLVAFLFADTLTALYATSIAFGLAQGGIVPSYAIIIRTFLPARDAGWRIATALLFTIGGMALGGWMAGALYDLTGSYTVAYVNAIAFNVLNLVIAAYLVIRARRAFGTSNPVAAPA